jgi:hypothetical protein
MATAAPSIGVLRAQIRAIRNKIPAAKVFGIFSPARWTGPSLQGEGSEQIVVYQCDSPLQMRLALQSAQQSTTPTVLVTPLDQAKLSDDILLRMASRKLHPINSWEIVRSLFKAKLLDPRLTRHSFLADMLLEHAGTREFPPAAAGLLDADTAWSILLTERLGLFGEQPDLVEILRCSAEGDLAARWQACTLEFRNAASGWIAEKAGDAAGAVLRCIETEHGHEALAIGLVMGVVYDEAVAHELDKAAGRLEAYAGTTNLSLAIAKRWRNAAAECIDQISRPAQRRCLEQAEAILNSVGATAHAWRSTALESGFEQRLTRFGLALTTHVDSRATSLPGALADLHMQVRGHRMARDGGRRIQRAEMAVRLARWLANQNAAPAAKASDLVEMARGYAAEGGFVDWARQVLRGGEPNKDLAGAYVRLVDLATEYRETDNQRFGHVLADQHCAGNMDAGLIPVENVLEKIVAPVAQRVPVLVLLVDGMNWAVFRELASDICSRGWIELAFSPEAGRLIGLAALPSVTEVCRTSLFCGTLRRGQAFDETQGFVNHPALVAVSQAGAGPRLFHKAALEGDEDSSLAGEIRQALADRRQRVVGIVINAVDDHLDKGDQIDQVWTTEHIRVLQPILAEAKAAGRAVVLLSDHGHLLDRQTECREAAEPAKQAGTAPVGGLRWRRHGASVAREEIELTSARVVLPEGGRIVVPWSERIRYGPRKNGYHGGAAPQEMLIPIGILWSEFAAPEGLCEALSDVPSWWMEPTVAQPVHAPAVPVPKAAKARKLEPTLFDAPPPAPVRAAEPWIAELLRTELFAAQKKLAGRARIDDAVVERLLTALVGRGGSMTAPALAGTIGVPEHRLPGLLAIMQRLLNVEGYAILDRQDSSNTVSLNVPLLKKQFEIN